MNPTTCVETLVASGDIPVDSKVVSTNNKIVTISRSERIVARIGSMAGFNVLDSPQDVRYAHKAARLAGDLAPVVKPLHEEPIIRGDYVISSYPMLRTGINLDASRAKEIYAMTRDLGAALPVVQAGMELRRLDIVSYVQERLDHMRGNADYNQRFVGYMDEAVARMHTQYPFDALVQQDPALIHGDMKADNVVVDDNDVLQIIDLDSVAIGPRQYDLASWRLRSELGDNAPLMEAVDAGRQTREWDEESYRALIGWKAISSMSFTLRYEAPAIHEEKLPFMAESAARLSGLMPAAIPSAIIIG